MVSSSSSSFSSSSSLCPLLFSVSVLLTQFLAVRSQESPLFHLCMNDRGNFTANSTYATNLNRLISSLSSLLQNDGGFYNISVGGTDEAVNSISMCRGDIEPVDCVSCIDAAGKEITKRCPTQKEAIIRYESCMVRYSNRTIFNRMETTRPFYMCSPNNHTGDRDAWENTLRDLLEGLRSKAAAGGARKKFAGRNMTAPSFQTLFGLVQCTPDLSEQDCSDCLTRIFRDIPTSCDGKNGGRWLNPSCNFRFETSTFYNQEAVEEPTPPPPPASPPLPVNETRSIGEEGNGNGDGAKIAIFIVVPIVAVILLIAIVLVVLRLRKKKLKRKHQLEAEEIISPDSLQFDFGTIKEATNNFSSENKLGKGGFGTVYKGMFFDGRQIAVKRLSRNAGQGETEFKNEVVLVANLQHRNLVKLLGFSLEGNERLLVYEFVPNASLDNFIFDPIKRMNLDWETRYRIIQGISRGLLYLHEDSRLRIIHRDLKASNILLDDKMNPKIADFGMARLFDMDQTTQRYTNRIAGTYGYMAPEYAMHGQFSFKTDVYSFGVLILEIVSGQKNYCFRNGENVEDLLTVAWKNWREGTVLNLADPSLTSDPRNEILRCIHIALLCVQENVADRPTMASVILMLSSYPLTLPTPSQPAFFMHNNTGLDISSSTGHHSRGSNSGELKSHNLPLSVNDASISELYPR